MKKVLSFLLSIAMLLTATLSVSFSAYSADSYKVGVTVQYNQTTARSFLAMVNDFRTGDEAWYWNENNSKKIRCTNLSKLSYDYDLEKIAMQRAAEIAVYYSHNRPNGSSFFTAYNGYNKCGENIAGGYTTAEDCFEGWKESTKKYDGQGHRRVMLDSAYTSMAAAVVCYNGVYYWVQEYRNPVYSTTKTTAINSAKKKYINIAKSAITDKTVTSSKSSVTVKCGESVSLPQISAKIITENTWPQGIKCAVAPVCTWSSSDTGIAKISDGKIVANMVGKTTITTTALGKAFSIPVTVTVGDNGKKEASHVYTKKVTKAPTSTKTGVMTYTCRGCGYKYTKTISKIAKRSISTITAKSKAFKVTWKSAGSSTGYQVQYATNSKFTKGKKTYTIADKSKTSKTVKNLKAKKKYYVRIRTYRTINGKRYYSSWSKVRTVTTKS